METFAAQEAESFVEFDGGCVCDFGFEGDLPHHQLSLPLPHSKT